MILQILLTIVFGFGDRCLLNTARHRLDDGERKGTPSQL